MYIYIFLIHFFFWFLDQKNDKSKVVIEFLLNALSERGHTHRFNRTTPRVLFVCLVTVGQWGQPSAGPQDLIERAVSEIESSTSQHQII